jgi:hypothetical protein
MNFWNEPIEERSYSLLLQLRRDYDFVLIGGWAIFLYTKMAKSKDIDILVGYDELSRMATRLPIKKNDRLKKYETTIRGVSVDIYLPHYSNLIIAPEEIMKKTRAIEGFKVPEPEVLLALKQQAETERKGSVKGLKDRIDILSMLLVCSLDMQKYAKFVGKSYLRMLKEIVLKAKDEFDYLEIRNLREVKKKRKKFWKRSTVLSRMSRKLSFKS